MPTPNRVIDSGRGYWGISNLAPAQPVDGNGPLTKIVEAYGRGVAQAFGDCADDCHNIDRICRLPGTVNHKTGRLACVLHEFSHDTLRPIGAFPQYKEKDRKTEPNPLQKGDLDLDDFESAVFFLAELTPSPLSKYQEQGQEQEQGWRNFMFACAHARVTQPDEQERIDRIFSEVSAKAGGDTANNEYLYQEAIAATGEKLQRGEPVITGRSIIKLAHDRGWTNSFDAERVRAAMEKAAKDDVVPTFVRLTAGANVEPLELERLRQLAHKLSGVGLPMIDREFKRAKQRLLAQKNKGKVAFRDRYIETGEPKPSLANAVIALHALGVKARYDLFRHRIHVIYGGHSHTIQEGLLTDNTISAARSLINDTYEIDCGEPNTVAAIREIALDNAYDPVLDQLDEYQGKWDGTKRVDTWLIVYWGAEDTPLTRAIGRKLLIALCRRPRDPGCKFDNITVFEGPEGIDKSTLLQLLAGKEYFSDQSILGKSEKEQQEQREGVWLHEHADLAGMRKAEVERVKADASRQYDRARPAYGRVREDRPRRSVDCGSTNDEECLQSQTGNRRFWPVKTGKIDVEGFKRDREQLLGEAAAYEVAGESLTLDKALLGGCRGGAGETPGKAPVGRHYRSPPTRGLRSTKLRTGSSASRARSSWSTYCRSRGGSRTPPTAGLWLRS
jgi:hypothetical protein